MVIQSVSKMFFSLCKNQNKVPHITWILFLSTNADSTNKISQIISHPIRMVAIEPKPHLSQTTRCTFNLKKILLNQWNSCTKTKHISSQKPQHPPKNYLTNETDALKPNTYLHKNHSILPNTTTLLNHSNGCTWNKTKNSSSEVRAYWAVQAGVVNSLDFCPASLKSFGCFYFRCILSSQWKAVTVNLWILHCQL